MNSDGYFGPLLDLKAINEQQLSGHGWVLRGLCEYYEWKRDEASLVMIDRIVRKLALPTAGQHSSYPIDPAARKAGGGALGEIADSVGNWKVSTDVGCDFIFLDGITHAYKVHPSTELRSLADEMIDRYLQVDLVAIKAQAHASLTGLRALLRHNKQTGDVRLLTAVEQRFRLYRAEALTENYANYNWFGRPTATEPCAIVDSFILAVQLWQHTGNSSYLEDAHLIYFNGLGRGQRNNGGYGTDTCAGAYDAFIKMKHYEAYWCCTMRGGEGHARAIEYSYFSRQEQLYVPFFCDSKATLNVGGGTVTLRQQTQYPYAGKVTLHVVQSSTEGPVSLSFAAPWWTKSHQITVNGRKASVHLRDGLVSTRTKLQAGGTIVLQFEQVNGWRNTLNPHSIRGYRCLHAGPILLCSNAESEVVVPNEVKVVQDDERRYRTEPGGMSLERINDLNELAVPPENECRRQVLFRV